MLVLRPQGELVHLLRAWPLPQLQDGLVRLLLQRAVVLVLQPQGELVHLLLAWPLPQLQDGLIHRQEASLQSFAQLAWPARLGRQVHSR